MIDHAAHFPDEASRHDAAHLGMWVFLVSEVLLFAALFTSYALYRADYGEVFALGRRHMAVGLGTLNTYLLVSSSVLVALAVHANRRGARARSAALIASAMALGFGFLCIKAVEYRQHVLEGALPGAHYHLAALQRPGAALFFSLYWLMTAVHALHVLIGLGVLGTFAVLAARGRARDRLELAGMYWHLVDVIWLFLWPLFYLA